MVVYWCEGFQAHINEALREKLWGNANRAYCDANLPPLETAPRFRKLPGQLHNQFSLEHGQIKNLSTDREFIVKNGSILDERYEQNSKNWCNISLRRLSMSLQPVWIIDGAERLCLPLFISRPLDTLQYWIVGAIIIFNVDLLRIPKKEQFCYLEGITNDIFATVCSWNCSGHEGLTDGLYDAIRKVK